MLSKIKIGIVICTLNCKEMLERCLISINKQTFAKQVTIYISDSESTDGTLELAYTNGCKVIENVPKGYMEGRGMAKNLGCAQALKDNCDYICTIDSDNAFVEEDWLEKMIYPLEQNPEVPFSICRMAIVPTDKAINRYCSYMGTDSFAAYKSVDPQIALGNLRPETEIYGGNDPKSKENYKLYRITKERFLIVGGYYTCFRAAALRSIGGYWRDVDNLWLFVDQTTKRGESGALFAMPHGATIHHLQATGFWNHIKKKVKWGRHYFKEGSKDPERKFQWAENKKEFYWQVIKCLLFFPALWTSIRMLIKYKDSCWWLHAPMTWMTTCAYIWAYGTCRK